MTPLHEWQQDEITRQNRMDAKLTAAKQYLADRGIAALGPNSTFIYTDSKGERHERTTTRRTRVLPASSPSHADGGGAATYST